jgi:hypothetical protein
VTNPVSHHTFYFIVCTIFFSSFALCNVSSLSHDRSDFYPSPVPHFKSLQFFLVYFPNCPIFSTIQSHAPNVQMWHFSNSILNLSRICWWREFCWMLLLRRQSWLWGDYWTEIDTSDRAFYCIHWKVRRFEWWASEVCTLSSLGTNAFRMGDKNVSIATEVLRMRIHRIPGRNLLLISSMAC